MDAVGLKNRWHVQCHVLSFPDTALLRRLRHMTVGAADLALRDLFEDRVPLEAVQRHVGDVRALVSKMIEVQNDRIALPAVDTWMSRQVLPHTGWFSAECWSRNIRT